MTVLTIIDPVTRIEGHMKVEVSIEQDRIVDARCTGTLFRGFETIMAGREPHDAPVITQRICGVCPISHGQASVLCIEDAAGWTPPTDARLLRNLTLGANFIQSHLLHFYLLAALDYVRGPQVGPFAPAWNVDLRSGLDEVAANLTGKAIEARRRTHEMGAVFSGRMPTAHTFIPGGYTATPNGDRIAQFREHLTWLKNFIANTYLPDVETVAEAYADYFTIGAGSGNLLAYGVFEEDDRGTEKLLNPGYCFAEDRQIRSGMPPIDQYITESVARSWYSDEIGAVHPAHGQTVPEYPKNGAYSWLKAPRYLDMPFEVGPLARMRINGDYGEGVSVMDRHCARALETAKIAQAMGRWLDELSTSNPVYDGYELPLSGYGVGLTEAPRGALGHWIYISDHRIEKYQIITPTCWNASPRDGQDVPGPMEQALIGTPVEDADQPVEALRVIHSFDPCLSCAVHVITPGKAPQVLHTGGK